MPLLTDYFFEARISALPLLLSRKYQLQINIFLLLSGASFFFFLAMSSTWSRSLSLPKLKAFDKAAFDGDAITVSRDLNRISANAKDERGRTPLMIAAETGHIAVLDELVAAGADVNSKSNLGWTPLMAASGGNHARAIRLLLRGGASINTADINGRTALMGAAFLDNKKAMLQLLENGADPNLQDSNGWTATRWAADAGHSEAITMLRSFGADPDLPDWHGLTPILAAEDNGARSSVTNALTQSCDRTADSPSKVRGEIMVDSHL